MRHQSIIKILLKLSIVRTFLNAVVHTKNVTCDRNAFPRIKECVSAFRVQCMIKSCPQISFFGKNLLHLVLFTTSKPSRVRKVEERGEQLSFLISRKRRTTQTSNLVLIDKSDIPLSNVVGKVLGACHGGLLIAGKIGQPYKNILQCLVSSLNISRLHY